MNIYHKNVKNKEDYESFVKNREEGILARLTFPRLFINGKHFPENRNKISFEILSLDSINENGEYEWSGDNYYEIILENSEDLYVYKKISSFIRYYGRPIISYKKIKNEHNKISEICLKRDKNSSLYSLEMFYDFYVDGINFNSMDEKSSIYSLHYQYPKLPDYLRNAYLGVDYNDGHKDNDSSFYNDNMDMDQQSPEFWDDM